MENSSSFVMPNSHLVLHGLQPPTPPEMSEGWSEYIDDLMAAQDMLLAARSSSFGSAGADSSSTVSDATSCVPAWNRTAAAAAHVDVEPSKACKENTRARGCDDPLEDTASSPLSSSKENGVGSIANLEELKEMEMARGSYEYSELRRRGLCLVPVSMLINYLK